MSGEVRAPRLRLLADGVDLPGVLGADVWSNNYLAADRFHVRLAAGAGAMGIVDAPGVRLDLQVGLGGDWTSLVQGEADTVALDPIRGVMDLEGRDLSALLIDSRVDETFANQTSSEIAVLLAARHGLAAAADRTETLVGRYYQSEHDRTTMGQFSRAISEWDLLAYLAQREGFDLFLEGDALWFGAGGTEAIVEVGVADCLGLQMEHALGMQRAIEVTVRSWDQRGGEAVVQTARGGGGGRAWRHSVVRPNLPPDEAQRLAERTLADLVRHERTVRMTMPGELSITPRRRVALVGAGPDWDRVYGVREVSRHVDVRHGFTQRVSLQGAG